MWLIQLGEIIFGGVGSGLYGMLVFAIVAVFVSGLMVGRTPEFLGKKIEAYEMKMASLVILIPPAAILIGTASPAPSRRGPRRSATPPRTGTARSSIIPALALGPIVESLQVSEIAERSTAEVAR